MSAAVDTTTADPPQALVSQHPVSLLQNHFLSSVLPPAGTAETVHPTSDYYSERHKQFSIYGILSRNPV